MIAKCLFLFLALHLPPAETKEPPKAPPTVADVLKDNLDAQAAIAKAKATFEAWKREASKIDPSVAKLEHSLGAAGKVGPAPKHEWNGTQLRFQNPDGTWGQWVDLRGPKGDPGVAPVPPPIPVPVPVPTAEHVWIITVSESGDRTTSQAQLLGDTEFWRTYQKSGNKFVHYDPTTNKTDLDAIKAWDRMAEFKVSVPCMLIADLKTGKVIKAVPLPANQDAVRAIVNPIIGAK